jgi:hypothetical protein
VRLRERMQIKLVSNTNYNTHRTSVRNTNKYVYCSTSQYSSKCNVITKGKQLLKLLNNKHTHTHTHNTHTHTQHTHTHTHTQHTHTQHTHTNTHTHTPKHTTHTHTLHTHTRTHIHTHTNTLHTHTQTHYTHTHIHTHTHTMILQTETKGQMPQRQHIFVLQCNTDERSRKYSCVKKHKHYVF